MRPVSRWLGASLARRLAGWAIAIAIGTLAMGMLAGLGAAAWSAQRQAEADARAAAQRLADALTARLADIDTVLGVVARNALIVNGLTDSSALEDVVTPLLRDNSVTQRYGATLWLCDAFAIPVASSGRGAPDSESCGRRADVEQSMASGQQTLRLADAHHGPTLHWIVPLRLPATGTHEGVLVATLPLQAVLRTVAGPLTEYASLLADGETVATFSAGSPPAPHELISAAVATQALPGYTGPVLQVRLKRASPLTAVPWGSLLGGYAIGAIVLSLVAGSLAIVMARRLLSPFEAIGRLAGSAQGGEPEAWSAFAHERDESGMLAQRLHDLTLRLAQQRTELEEARRAAERANAAKTEFLAMMSHELRTPLNAVTGLAALALEADDEDRRRHLQQLQRSAQRLRLLVDGVLDLARIESGHLELALAPCALQDILAAVRDATLPAATAKGLPLHIDLTWEPARMVRLDPLRVTQVLINLVANAIKFTSQGEVRLRASCRHDELVFEVTDTGIGIAPQDLPLIFEAFRQADASTARRFGGSGLGLAICQRLVELMAGRIEVHSVPGRGSRFTVALPCRVVEAPQARAEAPASESAVRWLEKALSGRAVLVVEDDDVNRLITGALMRRLGLAVLEARSGEEALRLLRDPPQPVGAVLMDCHMPGFDGFETTRQLRADPALAGLPVIACTADVLTKDRERCREAGMDDYVSKPIDSDSLVLALQRGVSARAAAAPSARPAADPSAGPGSSG